MTSTTIAAHAGAKRRRLPARNDWATARARAAEAARSATARMAGWRRIAMSIAGFGFADAAAYTVTTGVGLLATGASFLLAEAWLSSTD